MSNDFQTLLKGARRARRTVPVCMRGDLVEQYERLERELADAERSALTNPAAQSLEHEPEGLQLARRIEAVRAEMLGSTHTFVLEALPGPRYRALKAEHPPRRGDDGEVVSEDRILDANYDTFLEPLLRASLVDPVLDDATWAQVNDVLSDGQFNTLINAAFNVNKGGVDVPFSHAASRLLGSTASE